jgi:hypothetical protein
MRTVILFMMAFTTEAGVVRGVVSEHASGLPLARTRVQLQPVPRPGVETRPLTMRAESSGSFVFQNVPGGMYLLIATRNPYFPAAFGQRRPEAHGTPIEVTKDSDLFAELRMYRKGAVTGRVLDENGIGMEGVPVIAYRARLPLRAAGRAVSDDRGVYRVYGLDPGKYWVRTVAHTLDDGEGRLPTFGREGREISESHVHPVRLDEDTPDADVRPFPGRLFTLRGRPLCEGGPVIITLSSETGRRTTQVNCMNTYVFEGLAPGVYQVLAAKQGEGADAGFIEVQLDHNTDNGDVQVSQLQRTDFIVRRAGASGAANIPVTIYGHRQDLSESEDDKEIPLRAMLAPGQWEFTVRTGPGMFVQSMTNPATHRRSQMATFHPPDWFDLFIEGRSFSQVTIVVSDQAAVMRGSVTRDTQGVPGAPVFLWPMEESARRSLHGWRETITDVDGHFKFDGLPSGDYRMMATFDVTEVDEEKLGEAHAITVHVDLSGSATVELPLWIAP